MTFLIIAFNKSNQLEIYNSVEVAIGIVSCELDFSNYQFVITFDPTSEDKVKMTHGNWDLGFDPDENEISVTCLNIYKPFPITSTDLARQDIIVIKIKNEGVLRLLPDKKWKLIKEFK